MKKNELFKYYLITHCNSYLYDKRTDKIRHNKETIIIHDITLKFTPSKYRAEQKTESSFDKIYTVI